MRFGSKVLFDDVTTTFSAGRRYGLTGPNGAGKSTFMKLLTGEQPPQKGTVVAPGQGRRAAAGSVRLRPVPRHRHGRSWATSGCGARSQERELLYAKTDDDRRRRHAPRRARGHRRRRGRLRGREPTPRSCCRASTFPKRCTTGRCRSCRADRRCACCSRRRCSANPRRCCSTSRPTISTSTRSTGCASSCVRYEGTLIVISHDRHFLNARLHAHRRHRLPDDHHLHRRLRRHGARQDADPLARRGARTRSARRRSRSCRTSSRASRPARAPAR